MSTPTDPRPDHAAAAHRELDARLAQARAERMTGSVTVTVHVKDGSPNGSSGEVHKASLTK